MKLRGAVAALATRHGKERVIAPVLARLGADVRVAAVDTDRFGTLDGEVPRLSTPLATAKAKARAAFAAMPDAELALASVGSFEASPGMPLVDEELILLVHRDGRFRVTGTARAAAWQRGAEVDSAVAAEQVAERLGFPRFGVLVVAAHAGQPAPLHGVARDLRTRTELCDAAANLISRRGSVWVEPDRRADRNPERMQVIARAAENLEHRLLGCCLSCGAPMATESERNATDGRIPDVPRHGAWRSPAGC